MAVLSRLCWRGGAVRSRRGRRVSKAVVVVAVEVQLGLARVRTRVEVAVAVVVAARRVLAVAVVAVARRAAARGGRRACAAARPVGAPHQYERRR